MSIPCGMRGSRMNPWSCGVGWEKRGVCGSGGQIWGAERCVRTEWGAALWGKDVASVE